MRKFFWYLLLFCQPLGAAEVNLVNNPGFETKAAKSEMPAGGWWAYEGRGTTTARVDNSVVHGGKASLQLKGGVDAKFTFVSQKFEVAPGDELHFETWVRATAAATNAMASAGLAFRHRDGRVIQRDYFKSGALGENWTLISGVARAPTNAVSAEVHLGYSNGPVAIWYDDVFASITNPISFALVEGAKTWPGQHTLVVKVTNRSATAFRGTVSCALGHMTNLATVAVPPYESRNFNLSITLNGVARHRYKLTLVDSAQMPVHELAGTFPTTAPLSLYPACPCYLVAGQANSDVRVDARVNVNPAERKGMKFKAELRDALGKILQDNSADSSQGELTGCSLNVPVGQPGLFVITAHLIDSDGKDVANDDTEVHVVRDEARVVLGADGFLRVNGQPGFPIGIYNCGRFEEMGQAGFNATHEYGIVTGEADDDINPNERHVQELLDKSWANGLRTMIELPRKAIEKGKWEQVRRRVDTFRHHPGLLCWGSEERVARGTTALTNIAALYLLLHEHDPDHPLVLGDTRDVIQKLQVDRRDFFPDPDMDIGIWWWYPIPLKDSDGNGLEGGNRTLLEPPSWLTTTLSKKPLWIAIQAYQQPWKTSRFPTPAEYRCQAYLSIIHGVKGLFFYVGYGQKDYLGKPSGVLNKPVEGHWDYVKKLAGELRDFTPVIVAPQAKERLTAPANAPIDFTTRVANGKIYLITASKSPVAQKAAFTNALLKRRHARALYEDYVVKAEGETLTDEFSPFGVHIYELSNPK